MENQESITVVDAALENWALVPKAVQKPDEESMAVAIDYLNNYIQKLTERAESESELKSNILYVKASNCLTDINAKIEKAIKKANQMLSDNENDYDKAVEEALARLDKCIKNENLHFNRRDGKYYVKHEQWHAMPANTLTATTGLLFSGASIPAISDTLNALKRVVNNVVCTFKPTRHDELNILDTGKWVEPMAGDYHEIIDILLQSVTDDNPELLGMLEEWILYKYFKPEDHRLMCLIIYGEGKCGKTEFVNTILKTLFGGKGVNVLKADDVFGDHNGEMLGAVVTLVDEFSNSRKFVDNVKMMVGSATIGINCKYGMKGVYDNTSAYIFAANDDSPLNFIKGDSTDARYGLIRVTRNIILHTMIRFGHETDHLVGKTLKVCRADENYIKCEKWYNQNLQNLDDKEQIAKWFGSLVKKHSYAFENGEFVMDKPMPLFDGSYDEAIENNASNVEKFCKILYDHPEFKSILQTDMYNLYKSWVKENGSGYDRNSIKSRSGFWLEVINYTYKMYRHLDVMSTKQRVKMKIDGVRKSVCCVRNKGKNDWNEYKSDTYYQVDKHDKPIYDIDFWLDFDGYVEESDVVLLNLDCLK